MTEQAKSPDSLSTTNSNTIAKHQTLRIKKSLRDRVKSPDITDVSAGVVPETLPNRLALLLDSSGSMRGQKITSLRDACTSFIQSCNFHDTALALQTFGAEPEVQLPLTVFEPILTTTVQCLHASGGTPMANAMDYVLKSYSITRAVLVSDGQPDSETRSYDAAYLYKEAQIPIDCVHIGDSTQGESCLQRIAEITGGQFIKFTDIQAFARSFKYLTPAFYGVLTSGGVTAEQLGAREIK